MRGQCLCKIVQKPFSFSGVPVKFPTNLDIHNTDTKTRSDILRYVKVELENKQQALNGKRAKKSYIEKEMAAIEREVAELKIVESFFEKRT